jgi:hypothetical protein
VSNDPLYPPTFFGGNHWQEHPLYPLHDWQYEVANDTTRLGYANWCRHRWYADNDNED